MSHIPSKVSNSEKIRKLNDFLRENRLGGKILITRGVLNLGEEMIRRILNTVSSYDDFTRENDPYGEHDFGIVTIERNRIYWKIDYYDKNLQFGSEDPANPEITKRVLTVMLAEEY